MKKPSYVTIEQRLSNIQKEDDIQAQIKLAVTEGKKLRSARRKAVAEANTLEAKVEIGGAYDGAIKNSEYVVHRLRVSVFDIEDALNAGQKATSVIY